MLNENIFKENLNYLAENFGFQVTQVYIKLIYSGLKDVVTDEHMNKTTEIIIRDTTAEDWSKDYGYGGKPPLADWLMVYEMKKKWKCDESTGYKMVEISKITNNLRIK